MRKVFIRRDNYRASIFQLEQMIKDDYKDIYKHHIDELENSAENIMANAKELCPVYQGEEDKEGNIYYKKRVIPGALRDSINVRVSRSHRYPGIIAEASAKNTGKGWDYAMIQEENEKFSHIVGQAHYLSQPFIDELEYLMDVYGSELELPVDLQDIRDFVP